MKKRDYLGVTIVGARIVEYAPSTRYGDAQWIVELSCGHRRVSRVSQLRGKKRACRECAVARQTSKIQTIQHGEANRFGKGRSTKEYISWRAMLKRCYYPRHHNYSSYGGRGVIVCERWRERKGHGFTNFLADVGRAPSDEHTLDRINPFGNYEPCNVRWATPEMQKSNRRGINR